MKDKKLDAVLHPIRMKIVQTLIGDRSLTTREIHQRLTEVPQATLYRHLKKLEEVGIIQVVSENKIRGTTEKVYALMKETAPVDPKVYNTMTSDEHFNYFMTFAVQMLEEFNNYIQQDTSDPLKDGVGYWKATLYLTDVELMQLMQEISKPVEKAAKLEPNKHRKARNLSTVLIPQVDKQDP